MFYDSFSRGHSPLNRQLRSSITARLNCGTARPANEIVLPGGLFTYSVTLLTKIAFNDGYAILRRTYSLKYGEDLNGTLTRNIHPPAVFAHSKCCKQTLQSMPPMYTSVMF
jgi:hypothetical protein